MSTPWDLECEQMYGEAAAELRKAASLLEAEEKQASLTPFDLLEQVKQALLMKSAANLHYVELCKVAKKR